MECGAIRWIKKKKRVAPTTRLGSRGGNPRSQFTDGASFPRVSSDLATPILLHVTAPWVRAFVDRPALDARAINDFRALISETAAIGTRDRCVNKRAPVTQDSRAVCQFSRYPETSGCGGLHTVIRSRYPETSGCGGLHTVQFVPAPRLQKRPLSCSCQFYKKIWLVPQKC